MEFILLTPRPHSAELCNLSPAEKSLGGRRFAPNRLNLIHPRSIRRETSCLRRHQITVPSGAGNKVTVWSISRSSPPALTLERTVSVNSWSKPVDAVQKGADTRIGTGRRATPERRVSRRLRLCLRIHFYCGRIFRQGDRCRCWAGEFFLSPSSAAGCTGRDSAGRI